MGNLCDVTDQTKKTLRIRFFSLWWCTVFLLLNTWKRQEFFFICLSDFDFKEVEFVSGCVWAKLRTTRVVCQLADISLELIYLLCGMFILPAIKIKLINPKVCQILNDKRKLKLHSWEIFPLGEEEKIFCWILANIQFSILYPPVTYLKSLILI